MKLYAPAYYKEFKCIADRCSHSCCIGWEIDVDPETLDMYAALEDPYSVQILKSIEYNETPHFCLDPKERCPHLDERGLCRIILNVGEEYLCEICREHPRFYQDTLYGKEVGVGMACEEASRLILASDSYQETVEIGEVEGSINGNPEIDTVAERTAMYQILSDRKVSFEERLWRLSDTYKVYVDILDDEAWRELLDTLEYLNPAHRELFSVYSSETVVPPHLEVQLERALAYFIYRNCTACYTEEAFYEALGFALFCERLIASMAVSTKADDIAGIARSVSEELEYCEENKEAILMQFEEF